MVTSLGSGNPLKATHCDHTILVGTTLFSEKKVLGVLKIEVLKIYLKRVYFLINFEDEGLQRYKK